MSLFSFDRGTRGVFILFKLRLLCACVNQVSVNNDDDDDEEEEE